MRTLHDPAVRRSLEARLDALRPDAPRRWGAMTADQMLWHVNQFLASAIGEEPLPVQKSPVPQPLLRFMVLYMPWPKSAPTNRAAIPDCAHDFEGERARCKALIDKFVSRPIDGTWPVDPNFGAVTGKFASGLQARHLDHHFKQFST
jgi:hypothetical protein